MKKWQPSPEKPLERVRRCDRTDCDAGLHCFLKHKKRTTSEGTCWDCGEALIDWSRVHKRDPKDVVNTVAQLKREHIRHEFWCSIPFSPRAENYARRRGRVGLAAAAMQKINGAIGKPAGPWDGQQTSFEDKGHALHYAQHATATCCRKCVEVWYGIPTDRSLTSEECAYFAALLVYYVLDRMPDLAEHPVRVPRAPRSTVSV